MTLLIWTLFYGPDGRPPLWAWGPLHVSHTAPRFALGMALKLQIFLAAGILFLSVTRIEEFAYALTRLGLPYAARLHHDVGLPSGAGVRRRRRRRCCRRSAVAVSTSITAGHGSGCVATVPVIVPVFMGALRRADQMAMALEARGFQSRQVRTVLDA